ncbi:MAG: tryptophan synthase subunit alpha [Actinomycetota bacterium]|nr:tryptophan synthase subunit alpha [Actinomycetota bacterium]
MSGIARIKDMFEGLEGRRAALVTYACGFYPDEGTSRDVVLTMLSSGADAVEIGIPFSDPVMDGPVIENAGRKAIEAGATALKVLGLISKIRERTEKPILIMSYYNPIYRQGLQRFVGLAGDCGVDGLVVPDLPPEEMEPLKDVCDESGIATCAFCSPTSTLDGIASASRMTTGFIYCVSLLGTTGARQTLSDEIPSLIRRARECTTLPLAVGVGISTPEHCREAGKLADAVIVGSALVKLIKEDGSHQGLSELVSEMRGALL